MIRRARVAACAAAALAAVPAVASAESLVYRDAAGDIAIANPDGGQVTRITTDASPALVYSAPGVDDVGGIVASAKPSDGPATVQVRDQDGAVVRGPFAFPMPLCASISPFRWAVRPDGVFAAGTYVRGNLCTGSTFNVSTRLVSTRLATAGTEYGEWASVTEPRWLRHPDVRLAGRIDDTIKVWPGPEQPIFDDWVGIADDHLWDIDSFDVHPTQNLVLMEQSPEGVPAGGERRDIALASYTDPPGAASAVSTVCTRDGLVASSTTPSRPRYSPDGTRIAWTGPAGIYVSPAPAGGGGECALSPALVIPGGRDVEWARVDVAAPPPGGDPGDGAPGPRPGAGGGTAPVKLAVGAVSKRTRAAFRAGLRLTVDAPRAGRITVAATVPKAVARRTGIAPKARGPVRVASATRRVTAAGRLTVVLKPTARAKARAARLKGVKLAVRVTMGTAKATRVVKLVA